MSETICIIGAVKEEIAVIRGNMEVEDSFRLGTAHAFSGSWLGRRLVLIRSGIGKLRAQSALSQAYSQFPLSLALSIGYAGGLDPALRAGDLVVANSVLELGPASSRRNSSPVLEVSLDASLVDRAMQLKLGIKTHRGKLITVDEAVCKPEDKRALARRCSALAVEMETAALLRLAREKDLPFLSVRSISDTADQELVDFSACIDDSGGISKVKAGWHILTHPGSVAKVRDLRSCSQKAARNLARFVEAFLRLPRQGLGTGSTRPA
ncbi:MAG: hypothetical protein ACE5GQ_06840 [Nitrospinales bacterium]